MKNIITAAVIAAATFTATTASAYEAKDCPSIAEAAGAIAQGRDEGLSLGLSKAIVEMTDFPSDIEYLLLEITDLAFRSPSITPEVMELMTLQVCVDQFSTDT
jgi:hypothetical protein